MYEKHFGLKKRPFRASATGTDVFVGPQIAATMLGLKKTLATSDAVVTVSGAVGSGKTTLVNRALESAGDNRKVVRIPRMRLDSGDVLEFILNELGVTDMPGGAIRRVRLFRQKLKELEDSGASLFVVIEDCVRLGADTLAEVEALTAADAGDSEGTGIVLMGSDGLDELLSDNQLARAQQRVRQRFTVASLPVAELRGYLRHCFRLAGGDFEQVFEANAAALLYHLGHGVPRTTNNLVESAMAAAADRDLARVPSELLARIAENEYGLSATGFDLTAPSAPLPVPKPEPEPVLETVLEPKPEIAAAPVPELAAAPKPLPLAESKAEPEQAAAPEPLSDAEPEPAAVPEPELIVAATPEPIPEPEIAEIQELTAEPIADDAIPELIQDTLPDLEILAPELATLPVEPDSLMPEAVLPELVPTDSIEPETALPELVPAKSAEPESDLPDWERDPTMAELKPDLAALELAMGFAKGDEPDPVPVAIAEKAPEPEIPELIPEITLDDSINKRIASKRADVAAETASADAEASNSDAPSVDSPKVPPKRGDVEIEKIAAELAKAKSIEDVDDRMAETLFGGEINFIASQVIADAVASANEEVEAAAVGEPAIPVNDVDEVVIPVPEPRIEVPAAGIEVTLETSTKIEDVGMDLSASQRLRTVRALNADLHPSIREPEQGLDVQPPGEPVGAPDPIEDQITSMTATLKTLQVNAPELSDDASESKSGFFSRFKRS